MNILLLGATGLTGKALTEKILKDIPEAKLTLFARSADELSINSEKVRIAKGNAENKDDLRAVMLEQDIVYCAISGDTLPTIAENIISVMKDNNVKRLIFTGAVGIYDDIPASTGGDIHNVSHEPLQVPNRKGADLVEASGLEFTILRPGFLRTGDENDYVITGKGEMAKGYITTLQSVLKIATDIIKKPELYLYESISITKNMMDEQQK
ncbi:MAG: NAD(P)H-binding protein [Eubacteriales bacterium]|nr:NAD(P)H-binding protein [Eubacteriales bacterium]